MARNKTKSYPESFRKEAVRLADLPENTAADVAEKLGIHVGTNIQLAKPVQAT